MCRGDLSLLGSPWFRRLTHTYLICAVHLHPEYDPRQRDHQHTRHVHLLQRKRVSRLFQHCTSVRRCCPRWNVIWEVQQGLTFQTCGAPIVRLVVQKKTQLCTDSQWHGIKWYLGHQSGTWGTSGKDRTYLPNLVITRLFGTSRRAPEG